MNQVMLEVVSLLWSDSNMFYFVIEKMMRWLSSLTKAQKEEKERKVKRGKRNAIQSNGNSIHSQNKALASKF